MTVYLKCSSLRIFKAAGGRKQGRKALVVDNGENYDRIGPLKGKTGDDEANRARRPQARGEGASPRPGGRGSHFTSCPGEPGRAVPVTGHNEMRPQGRNQGGTAELALRPWAKSRGRGVFSSSPAAGNRFGGHISGTKVRTQPAAGDVSPLF